MTSKKFRKQGKGSLENEAYIKDALHAKGASNAAYGDFTMSFLIQSSQ
jgi:hypothetical protein